MNIRTKYLWILLQAMSFGASECKVVIPDISNIMTSLRSATSQSVQNMSQTGARKTVFFTPSLRKDTKTMVESPKSSSMASSDQVPFVIVISLLLLAPYIGPIVDNFYKSIGKGCKYLQSNLKFPTILEIHQGISTVMKEAWKELGLIMKLWGVSTADFVQFCIHYSINVLAALKRGVCSASDYALRQMQQKVSCMQHTVQAMAGACQSILVGGSKSLCAAYSNCKNAMVKNMKSYSSIMSTAFKNLYMQVLNNFVYITAMAAKAMDTSFCVLSTFIVASGDSSVKALKFMVDMVADGSSYVYSKMLMIVAFLNSITVKSATWSIVAIGKLINGVVVLVTQSVERLIDTFHFMVKNAPQWFEDFVEYVPFLEFGEDERAVFTKSAQRVLYLMSIIAATNPSVTFIPQKDSVQKSNIGKSVVDNAVKRAQFHLFPPRNLFMYGSLLRGLQTTSKLERVFQPSIGVGAVVNIGSILAKETWMVPIVAGWFISGEIWRVVGATVPNEL